MLSRDSEDKMGCDLCLNLWYVLKMSLWQDELNPRVRCAFGNDVLLSHDKRVMGSVFWFWTWLSVLYLKMREEINFPPSMNLWDAKFRGEIPISRLGLYPLCFIRVKFEIHIPGHVAWEEIYFWGELCIWQCFIIARGAQITRPHLLPIAKCHTMWEMWKAEWRWCTVW